MLIMFVDLDALYIDFVFFFFHYYFIHEYFTCILAYFVFLFKGFQRIVPFSVFTRKYNPANKENKEKKLYDLPTTTSLENGVQVFTKTKYSHFSPFTIMQKNANKKEYCMK